MTTQLKYFSLISNNSIWSGLDIFKYLWLVQHSVVQGHKAAGTRQDTAAPRAYRPLRSCWAARRSQCLHMSSAMKKAKLSNFLLICSNAVFVLFSLLWRKIQEPSLVTFLFFFMGNILVCSLVFSWQAISKVTMFCNTVFPAFAKKDKSCIDNANHVPRRIFFVTNTILNIKWDIYAFVHVITSSWNSTQSKSWIAGIFMTSRWRYYYVTTWHLKTHIFHANIVCAKYRSVNSNITDYSILLYNDTFNVLSL